VNKSGYAISPESQTEQVHYVLLVKFAGLTANGTAGTVTTAALALSFNKDITGLSAEGITLTGGAEKGTLSGSRSTYTLAVSGITER
jgi:hypothetical protein